jgi:7-keto-8-aminopelargonate synthetase-like enzyme
MGLLDCLGHGVRSLHSLTPTLREGPGLVIKKGDSPIVPVMLLNAKLGQTIARDLFYEGIYVIGFFFPVVPAGQARIRTQMSADHEIPQLEQALLAFKKIGAKYGILGLDKKGIIEKYGM